MLFENYSHILHSRYQPTIMGIILKYKQTNKCVCVPEIIQLIIMKIKMKIKNRSYRYNIRSWHGHRYSTCKKYLTMIMVTCIKQCLTNIWSSIHENVKQHCGWVEKSVAYKKSLYAEYFTLRILTAKKYRQIKLQHLQKVRIWVFGLLVYETKIFQK